MFRIFSSSLQFYTIEQQLLISLSPWQPLLPAFHVSTLFRSQLRSCVITSLLHLPPPFRSASSCATPPMLGFHSTEPPLHFFATFTLSLDVPYVSFIDSHSLKCLFHGLQLLLHEILLNRVTVTILGEKSTVKEKKGTCDMKMSKPYNWPLHLLYPSQSLAFWSGFGHSELVWQHLLVILAPSNQHI